MRKYDAVLLYLYSTLKNFTVMKIQVSGAKAGFIGRSLLWSLLLYGCFMGVCHRQAIKSFFGKDEIPVAYTTTVSHTTPVKVYPDTVHKGIRVTGRLWHNFSTLLQKLVTR